MNSLGACIHIVRRRSLPNLTKILLFNLFSFRFIDFHIVMKYDLKSAHLQLRNLQIVIWSGRYFKAKKVYGGIPVALMRNVWCSWERNQNTPSNKTQKNKQMLIKIFASQAATIVYTLWVSGPMKLESRWMLFFAHRKWWLNGTWVWLLV